MNRDMQKLLTEVFRLKLNNSCLKDFFETHNLGKMVSNSLLNLPMQDIVTDSYKVRTTDVEYLSTKLKDVIKLTFRPYNIAIEIFYSISERHLYEIFTIEYTTLTKDFT